ncbi:hypothetical protein AVEN_175847-1 [Araneus ventricosus]|uniref:Uncharacterized protein n=1 Tax=Araneus ventricosus TaxID=182803 RepID=A0A4Y1ZRE4_ARAVE|nr:hypothetical protein AVEN_175847-1 [Araneus ventricosus]
MTGCAPLTLQRRHHPGETDNFSPSTCQHECSSVIRFCSLLTKERKDDGSDAPLTLHETIIQERIDNFLRTCSARGVAQCHSLFSASNEKERKIDGRMRSSYSSRDNHQERMTTFLEHLPARGVAQCHSLLFRFLTKRNGKIDGRMRSSYIFMRQSSRENTFLRAPVARGVAHHSLCSASCQKKGKIDGRMRSSYIFRDNHPERIDNFSPSTCQHGGVAHVICFCSLLNEKKGKITDRMRLLHLHETIIQERIDKPFLRAPVARGVAQW